MTKIRQPHVLAYPSLLLLLLAAPILLPGCSNDQTPVVVTQVVTLAGEEVVVTRLVTETVRVTPITVTAEPVEQPVTLDIGMVLDSVPTIDPQKAESQESLNLLENIFAGLTRFNQQSNQIEPELASSWDVEDGGRTWTFHLRSDVFWVKAGNQGSNGMYAVTAVRPVVAGDIVTAVQRACSRETNTPDAFILFLIEGCELVNKSATATPADLANIGVKALNDVTLRISLTKPASQFLTITSMWFFRPVPTELIEELGSAWQTSDALVTSGPFFPQSSDFRVLQRNSLWPLPVSGNVDLVNIFYASENDSLLKLWEAKRLDVLDAASLETEALSPRTSAHLQIVPEQTLFYVGFNFESGVLREPNVRRALSAAIDREALVEQIYGDRALPMRHAIPPGVIAAPPIDQVGVGYSPDYARLQMADSGFGSCRLMPDVTFLVSSSDLSLRQAELMVEMWVDELACMEEQFHIEQVQFGTLLAHTRPDAGAARPDLWELGWASYYPDAQNWAGDLMHCQDSENRQKRPCGEVDDLIREAARTVDLGERLKLYREIENLQFGENGITPLLPLYIRGHPQLVQVWLDFAPALFGGEQFDTYQVDLDRKRIERSR